MSSIETALASLKAGRTVGAATARDVVTASGADTAEYLQGQLSQDVAGLDVGATAWSFLLQPQGKVDAWFRVTRLASDRFVIDVNVGFGSIVVERLNRFKLRVDVDLAMIEAQMVAVRGSSATEDASGLAEELGAVMVPASWHDDGRYDLLAIDGTGQPIELATGVLETTSIEWVDGDYLEWDRIDQGIPAMGTELDDSTIPAAAAVVDVSTDFTKGCYVGQELVARVDSRGSNTPTKLVRMSADTSQTVVPGAALTVEGAEAGHLTSAATSGTGLLALGYLRRSAVDGVSNWPVAGSVTGATGEPIDVLIELVSHPAGS